MTDTKTNEAAARLHHLIITEAGSLRSVAVAKVIREALAAERQAGRQEAVNLLRQLVEMLDDEKDYTLEDDIAYEQHLDVCRRFLAETEGQQP